MYDFYLDISFSEKVYEYAYLNVKFYYQRNHEDICEDGLSYAAVINP